MCSVTQLLVFRPICWLWQYSGVYWVSANPSMTCRWSCNLFPEKYELGGTLKQLRPNEFAVGDYSRDCKNIDYWAPRSQRFQFRRSAMGPAMEIELAMDSVWDHYPQRASHTRGVPWGDTSPTQHYPEEAGPVTCVSSRDQTLFAKICAWFQVPRNWGHQFSFDKTITLVFWIITKENASLPRLRIAKAFCSFSFLLSKTSASILFCLLTRS